MNQNNSDGNLLNKKIAEKFLNNNKDKKILMRRESAKIFNQKQESFQNLQQQKGLQKKQIQCMQPKCVQEKQSASKSKSPQNNQLKVNTNANKNATLFRKFQDCVQINKSVQGNKINFSFQQKENPSNKSIQESQQQVQNTNQKSCSIKNLLVEKIKAKKEMLGKGDCSQKQATQSQQQNQSIQSQYYHLTSAQEELLQINKRKKSSEKEKDISFQKIIHHITHYSPKYIKGRLNDQPHKIQRRKSQESLKKNKTQNKEILRQQNQNGVGQQISPNNQISDRQNTINLMGTLKKQQNPQQQIPQERVSCDSATLNLFQGKLQQRGNSFLKTIGNKSFSDIYASVLNRSKSNLLQTNSTTNQSSIKQNSQFKTSNPIRKRKNQESQKRNMSSKEKNSNSKEKLLKSNFVQSENEKKEKDNKFQQLLRKLFLKNQNKNQALGENQDSNEKSKNAQFNQNESVYHNLSNLKSAKYFHNQSYQQYFTGLDQKSQKNQNYQNSQSNQNNQSKNNQNNQNNNQNNQNNQNHQNNKNNQKNLVQSSLNLQQQFQQWNKEKFQNFNLNYNESDIDLQGFVLKEPEPFRFKKNIEEILMKKMNKSKSPPKKKTQSQANNHNKSVIQNNLKPQKIQVFKNKDFQNLFQKEKASQEQNSSPFYSQINSPNSQIWSPHPNPSYNLTIKPNFSKAGAQNQNFISTDKKLPTKHCSNYSEIPNNKFISLNNSNDLFQTNEEPFIQKNEQQSLRVEQIETQFEQPQFYNNNQFQNQKYNQNNDHVKNQLEKIVSRVDQTLQRSFQEKIELKKQNEFLHRRIDSMGQQIDQLRQILNLNIEESENQPQIQNNSEQE